MRASLSKRWLSARLGSCLALAWGMGSIAGPSRAGPVEPTSPGQVSEGLRLFLTDWSSVNQTAYGGDGLGPVFNERSCVACHGQGGTGGAGGSRVDVLILTDTGSKREADGKLAVEKPGNGHVPSPSDVFPGFAAEPSLVLHRYSKDEGYEIWRSNLLRVFGVASRRNPGVVAPQFSARASYRNTPALFGAGLIDALPEVALEAASLRTLAEFPEIKGRPYRLKDGRVGRFGWKAQTASLGDFVRTACANELGLENPGHPQSPDPLRPNYKAPGIDLTDAECTSLTAFVASLPRPVEPARPSLLKGEELAAGREVFAGIGCASCHMPKIGDIEGIYSDLLLHDMGQGLSDTGEYYGSPASPGLASAPPRGSEWRTPPLWGLHASAPYLHDGRAATVADAIAMHGGEAGPTVQRFKKLGREDRHDLNAFLLSLSAPPSANVKPKARAH